MDELDGSGTGVSDRIIERLRGAVTIDRVYGDPIERDGTTVIPVASMRMGGGGGGGRDEQTSGSGEGGGFGAVARPTGAYIIKEGSVSWKPALDLTRLIVAGNLTAVAYFFFTWRIARAKAKHR